MPSVDYYFDSRDKIANKRAFDRIQIQKAETEKEIGEPLVWERLDNNKQSRVRSEIPGKITDPPGQLEAAKSWALKTGVKFYDAFSPRIKNL